VDREKVVTEALAHGVGEFLVPGLGSLLGPAIGAGFQKAQEQKLREALVAAMCVEQPSHARRHVIKRFGAARRRRKLKKTARRALEDQNLRKLLRQNGKSGTASATRSQSPTPGKLRVRAEEILSAAGPMDRPTDWREAVAQMIQTTASAGLEEDDVNSAKATGEERTTADCWQELIAPELDGKPLLIEIEDYSRLVARAFEIELAERDQQEWLQRLDEENRLAVMNAQLDQIDGARTLLSVVAAALVVLAAEYGIHLIT
jgi:hypothetical protein